MAAQLGYSAVDKERANKQLEKEFNQFKSKWGNSPEAQAYREREAREREESNRQYEETKRQQERLQMEMLGQAAGMLGQVLQNKGGGGAAGAAPPMSLGGSSGANSPSATPTCRTSDYNESKCIPNDPKFAECKARIDRWRSLPLCRR